jgi:hypothetical protein
LVFECLGFKWKAYNQLDDYTGDIFFLFTSIFLSNILALVDRFSWTLRNETTLSTSWILSLRSTGNFLAKMLCLSTQERRPREIPPGTSRHHSKLFCANFPHFCVDELVQKQEILTMDLVFPIII